MYLDDVMLSHLKFIMMYIKKSTKKTVNIVNQCSVNNHITVKIIAWDLLTLERQFNGLFPMGSHKDWQMSWGKNQSNDKKKNPD
jgi:hypothetical protein